MEGEAVTDLLTMLQILEVTIGTIRFHPVASLVSGYCMQNKTTTELALDQATGGPMVTTHAWILLHHSAMWPVVSDMQEALQIGKQIHSVCILMTTSLEMRISPSMT